MLRGFLRNFLLTIKLIEIIEFLLNKEKIVLERIKNNLPEYENAYLQLPPNAKFRFLNNTTNIQSGSLIYATISLLHKEDIMDKKIRAFAYIGSILFLALLIFIIIVIYNNINEDEQYKPTNNAIAEATNGDIKIRVITAIANKDTAMILLDYDNLNNKIKEMNIHSEDVVLIDDSQNQYSLSNDISLKNLDSSENEDSGVVLSFKGNISRSQNVTLKVTKVDGYVGEWIVNFPIKYREKKEFNVDKEYEIYQGKVKVKKVICDINSTTIEFSTDNIDFLNYMVIVNSSSYEDIGNIASSDDSEVYLSTVYFDEGSLSDGTKGYICKFKPVLEDSILTVTTTYLDAQDKPYDFVIDLGEYQ